MRDSARSVPLASRCRHRTTAPRSRAGHLVEHEREDHDRDPQQDPHQVAVHEDLTLPRGQRRTTAGAGMRPVVHLPQSLLTDLCVHLRRRDRRVTEELLHDPQVGTVVKQMRRARVPKHVRRQPVREPGSLACGARTPRAWRTPPPPASVQEDRLGVTATSPPPAQRTPPRGHSQSDSAPRADRPMGTIRSLHPFCRTTGRGLAQGRDRTTTATSSEIRIPVA